MFNDPLLIDLSVPVDISYWEPTPVTRRVVTHQQGADLLGSSLYAHYSWPRRCLEKFKQWLGYGVDHRDFPAQKGLSLMTYQLTTHTGTHMDAPYHYVDRDAAGNVMKTISDIPLQWCFGRGVVLDLCSETKDAPISLAELQHALTTQCITLTPHTLVLFYTGSDRYLGTEDYFTRYRALTPEVIAYLLSQGIKVIGIDSFSFDRPFLGMLNDYLITRNPDLLWPTHLYGRNNEYCQLERLTHLEQLLGHHTFWISAFPIKLVGADAAWCRVVAIVPSTLTQENRP